MKTGIDVLKEQLAYVAAQLYQLEEHKKSYETLIVQYKLDIEAKKILSQELLNAITILEKSDSEQVKTKKQKRS